MPLVFALMIFFISAIWAILGRVGNESWRYPGVDASQIEYDDIGSGYPGGGYMTLRCPLRCLPVFVEEVAALKATRRLHPNGAEEVNKWFGIMLNFDLTPPRYVNPCEW